VVVSSSAAFDDAVEQAAEPVDRRLVVDALRQVEQADGVVGRQQVENAFCGPLGPVLVGVVDQLRQRVEADPELAVVALQEPLDFVDDSSQSSGEAT